LHADRRAKSLIGSARAGQSSTPLHNEFKWMFSGVISPIFNWLLVDIDGAADLPDFDTLLAQRLAQSTR
jgi:hypothetical protein